MSSSLSKILETGINVFISNSQIITIKTNYEKSADRSKISSDQKRFFIALSLYPSFIFRKHSLQVFMSIDFSQDFANYQAFLTSSKEKYENLRTLDYFV